MFSLLVGSLLFLAFLVVLDFLLVLSSLLLLALLRVVVGVLASFPDDPGVPVLFVAVIFTYRYCTTLQWDILGYRTTVIRMSFFYYRNIGQANLRN